ncbi:copper ion binding [Abeliophyllum distichum]|uniref:Copper ion binding n=1 Tax=Abeliophyllum distichum TaxID=126358 RepID=A0ABD1RPE7_9LAMI
MMRITEIKKLKPLQSSLESLSYQYLQRCSVSGTAKGKGKIKTGQTLKRSKITMKKGSADSSQSEGPRRRSEFDEMVDKCLSATSPVRFLKPKEKAREAEREKMGLISKSREQEIQKLKKKGKDFDSPMLIGTPGMDLITLGAVDADKIPKYELTVEDGRRLAKEYSRVLMRKHRARQAAESTLLRLKKEAIEALPENLKAAALVPDMTPFPVNRFMATLTPPIEGYIEKINEAARKSAGKEKLR